LLKIETLLEYFEKILSQITHSMLVVIRLREYLDGILPDALQNAGTDPYTSLVLSEAAERQAIHFGYDLDVSVTPSAD
jgi:hypothetical protein